MLLDCVCARIAACILSRFLRRLRERLYWSPGSGCCRLSQGAQQTAEALVRHFHLNPASHYPRIFIDVVHNMPDSQLLLMAAFSFTYTCIRFVEAYGLWRQKIWAKWFAVASGSIYVPIEIYELFFGITLLKVVTLIINICIVVYMSFVLWQSHQDDAALPCKPIN